jgi:hypothetical protein
LSLETHLIHTEDGYVLQVYSAEASLRYRIIRNGPPQKAQVESWIHLVHKEDGYVLQVYSNEASLR